jgi:hypothetical protein
LQAAWQQAETWRWEWERTKHQELTQCLHTAQENYEVSWEFACQAAGRGRDCTLPVETAERKTQGYRADQELCVKKYK